MPPRLCQMGLCDRPNSMATSSGRSVMSCGLKSLISWTKTRPLPSASRGQPGWSLLLFLHMKTKQKRISHHGFHVFGLLLCDRHAMGHDTGMLGEQLVYQVRRHRTKRPQGLGCTLELQDVRVIGPSQQGDPS